MSEKRENTLLLYKEYVL